MYVVKIKSGPYAGKGIQVTKYVRTKSGLDIRIQHNLPATAGKQHQWVQTVSSNNEWSVKCGMPTRVDPFGLPNTVNTVPLASVPGACMTDDTLPFYWTASDIANGLGPDLTDSPSWPAPSSGRVWNRFITALTEATGTTIHHLVAVTWGYDRMSNGTVRAASLRRPTVPEMQSHIQALKKMYPAYTFS